MSGTIKITDLANVGVLTGAERVAVVQSNQTKQCTTLQIAQLAGASSTVLQVGTTPITGGTSSRILYDNAGSLGEYLISGTGQVAMTNSPVLVTPDLGTPSAVVLTHGLGLPLTTGVTGNLPVTNLNSGTGATSSTFWRGDGTWAAAGTGSVTSVAQTFTGGLISVAGSPITTSGTLALTVAGTSGGIPYFSSSSTWASSGALAANALVIGGGAGVAPSTTTTGTGVLTALGINVGSAGAFVTFNGALGTPASGTLTNATGLPVGGISATGTPSSSTFLRGDGSWQTVTTAPAGSNTQVQFNNSGAFGASANLTWSSPTLTIGVATSVTGALALANATSGSAILTADAANTLALRNSTSAQASRVYNTFTDSSNGEWLSFDWSTSANVASILTLKNGTGTQRALNLGASGAANWQISTSGHFLAATDNTYNIGAQSATRPNNIFVGGSICLGGASAQYAGAIFGATSSSTWTVGGDGSGFYLTGQNGNAGLSMRNGAAYVGSTGALGWAAPGSTYNASLDTQFTRPSAATVQLGAADAASPVAQTLQVQSVVAGTSNTAGANWTLNGSKSTGSGVGGSIIFKTAPAGSSGTSHNSLVTAFTMAASGALVSFGIGTTGYAQVNWGTTSVAPASPSNGDMWFDGTDFKARVGGATKTFTLV